jgi:hypothetical protein
MPTLRASSTLVMRPRACNSRKIRQSVASSLARFTVRPPWTIEAPAR